MLKEIALIVAYNKNNGIGKDGKLLYHIPNDLKHFKEVTDKYPIVMGRKTFESLPNGALPNRENIVISKNKKNIDGAITFDNLGLVIQYISEKGYEKVFFIGGGQIYKEVLKLNWITTMYITYIDDDKEADTFFPPFNLKEWERVENVENSTNDGLKYYFQKYIRKY